jgi:hypothetical protein
MSDRLALSNAIEDDGLEPAKAERVALVIFDAMHDNVATKADVQALGAELKVEIERGRTETHAIRSEFATLRLTVLPTLETTLRSDMTQMKKPAGASPRRADGGARGPAVYRAPLWRARLSR